MLRKKQNLIQLKETAASRPNAKVTVQYIQPQRQPRITIPRDHMATVHAVEELEVENVEYLEEHTSTEDFIEDHSAVMVKDEELEDLFYPNAIHCLLDLYRDKYENVIIKYEGDDKKNHFYVWQDIAKEMQESYFEFEADQIRQKFSSLRQQYFDVNCSNDVENFEYFEQMHEIYKDPSRELLVKGGQTSRIVSQIIYKDEHVVKAIMVPDDAHKDHKDEFKSEEIVHKEHEFIDMVEKELQAMEEVEQKHELETKAVETIKEDIEQSETPKIIEGTAVTEIIKIEQKNLKRPLDEESAEEPAKQKLKLSESSENDEPTSNILPLCAETSDANTAFIEKSPAEFTLYHYNEQQERRHGEQMKLLQQQQQQQRDQLNLLEKSLELHEKSLQQQSQLLQELIKRFPPA